MTSTSVLVSFAGFAYSFGGHGLFPEELREMSQPRRWPEVMRWTYATMVPVYFVCMCVVGPDNMHVHVHMHTLSDVIEHNKRGSKKR